jgi:two-component system, cell cycle response regulator
MSHASTILIVDDEPFGREVLATLLQPQGYRLMFASDGPEALRLAVAEPPDLVLLDVMMPEMNGFEVCRRLRAEPLLREVPVIMLTALDDREARLEGFEAGADDFVSKPFDRVELRGRVRAITRLNRYRSLLAERLKFEWVVEHTDDGYLIASVTGQVLYANAQARLYLDVTPESYAHDAAFLDLASKQYQWESQADWAAWTARYGDQAPLPRLLVRPACATADQFVLQVDMLDMDLGSDERYLIHLRDITASIINQNAVWSFHGLVRHKLSTSLAQLVGALRLLDDLGLRPTNEQENDLFMIASQGATRLQENIRAIFQYMEAPDLIRPEHGRCVLADILTFLAELGAAMGLPAIHAEYGTIADLHLLWLAISRHGLELILGELLANARKFHPRHHPAVDVILTHVADTIHILVRDDGQTLSPEQLRKVWQPYYQAERFFTGQVAGMGLGLPMVAALIWRIGGTCRIYNCEPGPGVGVELIIPLVRDIGSAYA